MLYCIVFVLYLICTVLYCIVFMYVRMYVCLYVLGSTTVYNCTTHEPIIKQLQGFFNAGPSLCFPASVVWLSLATATICAWDRRCKALDWWKTTGGIDKLIMQLCWLKHVETCWNCPRFYKFLSVSTSQIQPCPDWHQPSAVFRDTSSVPVAMPWHTPTPKDSAPAQTLAPPSICWVE